MRRSSTKTIAVDFNGVIHKYSKGWQDGKIYDPILPGAIDGLKTLMMDGYSVYILAVGPPALIATHMNSLELGIKFEVIPDRVVFWEKPFTVGVTDKKIPFFVMIDDRAIRFTGDWIKTIKEVRTFKTWQQ